MQTSALNIFMYNKKSGKEIRIDFPNKTYLLKSTIVKLRYNADLGIMKITLLYPVSHIRVKAKKCKIYLDTCVRGFCYIRPLYNEVPV